MDKIALLSALAANVTTVAVDGFGDVRMRQLTVAENDICRAAAKADQAASSEFGLRLVMYSVIDEAGGQVFSEQDLPALRDAGGAKIDALVSKVLEHNGLGTAKN